MAENDQPDQPDAPTPFTPEELGVAQSAEQMALMEAQMEHLKGRVVLLHANLLRAQNELAELKKPKPRKAPADRRPKK